jgi:Methyltransferase domain
VEVHTADISALSFPDGSFNVVTSAMAIHNIPSPEGRYRAVDEAMGAAPGRAAAHRRSLAHGQEVCQAHRRGTLRPLGPGYWYGGPRLSITLLHAVKER